MNSQLGLSEVIGLLQDKFPIKNSGLDGLNRGAEFLRAKCVDQGRVIYGVNTGFGSMCNTVVPSDKLPQLQENLILSHACGTGPIIDEQVSRAILLLKIISLLKGNSGVRQATVERLVAMYDLGIHPVIHEQGSLGASGDLAPLAHLALPLLGKGKVFYNGQITDVEILWPQLGWEPLELSMKEGLALLNGTQFMGAFGTLCTYHSLRLSYLADLIGALSLDVFHGLIAPFHPLVHQVRPHVGHGTVSARILSHLNGSEMAAMPKAQVQDPYSFRCIPQVHGASLHALLHVRDVMETEINSVSDNPLVFPDEDLVISAGNFHGQPLALAMDYAAIAVAELGSISERRTYQLISGSRALPPYLINEPGLNSGFMIPQYTAASIASQNKQFCTPASIDSIVSSNGQEDHVSMGANAATKLNRVVDNVYQVLAIELITAAQGLDHRRPQRTSPMLEGLHAEFRKSVPYIESDQLMAPLLLDAKTFLQNYSVPREAIDLK